MMECLPGVPHLTTIIWVGGTSALARTYIEELKETIGLCPELPARFILAGVEEPSDENHVHLDVTSESSVRSFFSRIPKIINSTSSTLETRILVLSIRQPLVVTSARQKDLIAHIGLLVRLAVAPLGKTKSGGVSAGGGVSAVVHVSSVAVVDHLRAQHLDDEDTPMPPIESYKGDYDVFKRRSEEIINDAVAAGDGGTVDHHDHHDHRRGGHTPVRVVHLRIGGIWSNGRRGNCMQCSVLKTQWPFAVYVPVHMDCNSSRNVCLALSAILASLAAGGSDGYNNPKTNGQNRPRVYYYTRSSKQPDGGPCPYGEYLMAYRRAQQRCGGGGGGSSLEAWMDWALWTFTTVWLPWPCVALAIVLFNFFAGLVAAVAPRPRPKPSTGSSTKPQQETTSTASFGAAAAVADALLALAALIRSVDYLLQVASREHTFDNSVFHGDFPGVAGHEETPLEAFRRIRARQRSERGQTHSSAIGSQSSHED